MPACHRQLLPQLQQSKFRWGRLIALASVALGTFWACTSHAHFQCFTIYAVRPFLGLVEASHHGTFTQHVDQSTGALQCRRHSGSTVGRGIFCKVASCVEGPLATAVAMLEEEMMMLTDSTQDLHELFVLAETAWKGTHGANKDANAALQGAVEDLAGEARARRLAVSTTSKNDAVLAPIHLGPLGAVAMLAPGGQHEVVLLGTLHTSYCEKAKNPVPSAVHKALHGLKPSLVVVEMDSNRAEDNDLFPQHLKSQLRLLLREPPSASSGAMSLEDGVLQAAFASLGQDAPSLAKLRRAFLSVWEQSDDSRIFENFLYLQAYEARLRDDFASDMFSTVEAAAALGVPLMLGDVPLTNSMSNEALERTRHAFASRRAEMCAFLRNGDSFLRFETAKRRLTRSTMRKRGGANLDLLMRSCWLMEPPGPAYERMREALTELRDPFLAAALEEPEAEAVLRGAVAASQSVPVAVFVLGAAHLPGVATKLRAAGYSIMQAPSEGWPEVRSFSGKPPQPHANTPGHTKPKKAAARETRRLRAKAGFR